MNAWFFYAAVASQILGVAASLVALVVLLRYVWVLERLLAVAAAIERCGFRWRERLHVLLQQELGRRPPRNDVQRR
jgi:hypothetical protein